MKFLKNIFSKTEHEMSMEEQEKFNSMMGVEPTCNPEVSLEDLVSKLGTLGEINKIRNLLDERERALEGGEEYLFEQDLKHNTDVPEFEGEVNLEENIKEEDLNNETIEVENIPQENLNEEVPEPPKQEEITTNTLQENLNEEVPEPPKQDELPQFEELHEEENNSEPQINEIKEEEFVEITQESQKSEFEVKSELFNEKIQNLFGSENIFSKVEELSNFDVLRGKKVFHIGVRQKEGFSNPQSDVSFENAWFISHVKQLEELKEFKMIRSDVGIKDLVWDQGDFAFLISFRTTNLLSSQTEFDFKF